MIVEARISDYLRKVHPEYKECKIAEKIGVKQSRFSFILNGKAEMKLDEFMRLCVLLNTDPNEFIGFKKKE